MKNKGFTLIELLAVIVILAVLALLVTPIIGNLVNSVKMSLAKQGAINYVTAVNNQVLQNKIGTNKIYDGTYSLGDLTDYGVNVSGTKPTKVDLTISSSKVTKFKIVINGYVVTGSEDGTTTVAEEDTTVTYKDFVLNGADPVLTDGMIPVIIANDGTVTKADESKSWYNYTNKQWANMVLVKNNRSTYISASAGTTITQSDIAAYYVWIPRYKYAITEGTGSRLINVVFESKTTSKSTGNAVGTNYLTHPTFTFGTEETNGFWFGKFETTGDSTTPTILPNVSSLTGQNVSTQYTTAQKFANYLVASTSADSHMSKNSEWGAVAYLVNSIYGRCTGTTCEEVRVNNASDLITGYSAVNAPTTGWSAKSIATNQYGSHTDTTITQPYNTTTGYLASTTGNISGIYDMSGGSWEYVMGVLNNTVASSGFSTLPDSKYYRNYTTTDAATACSGICYGDALSETRGWNSDYANMPSSTSPWFIRGGDYYHGTDAGVVSFHYGAGVADGLRSFRGVLIP